METVYSKDIKDAANLMADDLVVVCVFKNHFYSIVEKRRRTTIDGVGFFFFSDSWDRQEPARAMCIEISPLFLKFISI